MYTWKYVAGLCFESTEVIPTVYTHGYTPIHVQAAPHAHEDYCFSRRHAVLTHLYSMYIHHHMNCCTVNSPLICCNLITENMSD